MPPTESDVDPRLLAALGHPLRQQILINLVDAPSSAVTLAADLGVGLPVVRRHLAVLLANDAVEAVDDDRKADDTRYRAMARPFLDDAHWRELPPHRRAALFAMTLRRIGAQVRQGFGEEFGHERTHVSFTRLQVDEQGWNELADLLAGVLEEAIEIEAESAARLMETAGGEQFESKLAIMHFGRRDAPHDT